MGVPQHPELSERAQHLLRVLIERYILDGQPVGSRYLSREAGLNLSPASIRNVMADLEELGLVRSPHTSAGRVPTVHGFRLFIDSLLTVQPLRAEILKALHDELGVEETTDELLEHASRLLARLTGLAGIVVLPKRHNPPLRHIEFLPLSRGRVLVILVTAEDEVQNRIIVPNRLYSASELQEASNYLNEQFAGKDLGQVREAVLREMNETRERMNQAMLDAIRMAHLALQREEESGEDRFVVSGETNLMDYAELSDIDRLRQLFDAFGQKRDLIHLLDQCLRADGVQIFLGEESGYRAFEGLSVVTSSYYRGSDRIGVLGVIGPTRMKYEQVIPVVDVTARLLAAALNRDDTAPI